MERPLAWLDAIVVAIELAGAIFAILTLRTTPGPRRGTLKLYGRLCLAAVFILGACDTLLTWRIAPRSQATGTIAALMQQGGRHPRSTFALQAAGANPVTLSVPLNAGLLKEGETVQAEWIAYNRDAVQITVIDGVNAGQQLHRSFTPGSIFLLVIGCFIAAGAFTNWHRHPDGEPESRYST